MATLITLPQFGPDMESGVISSWNKNVGDFVEAGELLAEVETDKAVFEFEVEEGGFLREILVPAGEEISVGTPIAVLADSKDEDISALLGRAPAAAPPATQPAPQSVAAPGANPAPQASPTPVASAPVAGVPAAPASVGGNGGGRAGDRVKISPHARKLAEQGNIDVALLTGTGPSGRIVAQDVEVAISSGTASGGASGIAAGTGPSARAAVAAAPSAGAPAGGRIKISPYGRRLAREHGIDVALLTGTGPTGRIVARDVEAAISSGAASGVAPAAAAPAAGGAPGLAVVAAGEAYEDLPLSMMRKAIAKKMEESKRTVPHFQATRKVRMERMVAMREQLKADFPDVKVSINDLLVKACAAALKFHPAVNSQYLGDKIRRFHTVDISVAVATEEGLITPIVRGADRKGVRQIAAEIRELAERARARKLRPEEYTGGTFTISNLGMYGIDEFNGIINTPQACLLAVSAIVTEPVVEGDAIVPGRTMNLTLSSDHRVVDGATAAEFLRTLTRMLENPIAMVL